MIETPALRMWDLVRTEIARVIADVGLILGQHLREAPVSLRDVARDPGRGVLELRTGRSSVRIDCPLVCLAPGPGEGRLAAIFGGETPVVRIFIHHAEAPASAAISWLAIDPGSGRWVSGRPDLGPAELSDTAAFECWVLSIVIDVDRPRPELGKG